MALGEINSLFSGGSAGKAGRRIGMTLFLVLAGLAAGLLGNPIETRAGWTLVDPLPQESHLYSTAMVDADTVIAVGTWPRTKGAVIEEAFRVLRPGGLFAVADMVELETLDPSVISSLDALVGCISGTIPIEQYRNELSRAGFPEAEFEVHSTQSMPDVPGKVGSVYIRARKPV